MLPPYCIPETSSVAELEIKRSRFLVSLDPISSREQALSIIKRQRHRYPDARHHCWAYVVGSPADASATACSDDGEPQGTAGKPMLNVLQKQGVGDCVAVVVRYFGGIKLGTGGLVRAYGGAVQAVLDISPLIEFEARMCFEIVCGYEYESGIRLIVEKLQGTIEAVRYIEQTYLVVDVLALKQDELLQTVKDFCRGQVEFNIIDSAQSGDTIED